MRGLLLSGMLIACSALERTTPPADKVMPTSGPTAAPSETPLPTAIPSETPLPTPIVFAGQERARVKCPHPDPSHSDHASLENCFADGLADKARFNRPRQLVSDRQGNIYVSDSFNHRIRKITPESYVSTLAGTGATYEDPKTGYISGGVKDGPAATAEFNFFDAMAMDSKGNLIGIDREGIRKITTNGLVSTFVKKNVFTLQGKCGSYSITLDKEENIFLGGVHSVCKLTPHGQITVISGNTHLARGWFSDGPPHLAAFAGAVALVPDTDGNIYIADAANSLIRRIAPNLDVSTFAGNGPACSKALCSREEFQSPIISIPDPIPSGYDYILPKNITVINMGCDMTYCPTGLKDGPAAEALFNHPQGLAIDKDNNLYVADTDNDRIRKITPDGIVSTIAKLEDPFSIALDPQGNLYCTSHAEHVIYKLAKY